MDGATYQELLAKYLKGDCTDEERALLDQWYESLDTEVALPATDEEKSQMLARNWQTLADQTVHTVPVRQIGFRRYASWAAAAAILLIGGLGWLFMTQPATELTEDQVSIVNKPALFTERVNRTKAPERVTLSDNSVITLNPGSKIRYPTTFAAQKREVILEGEAFFEIQKNPHKPFLVYSQDLITKVLGTSFWIKANPAERNVTVSVRTGRVSVYSPKLAAQTKGKSDPETIGVVLTPNQQVTYLNQEQRLVKTLVEKPVVVSKEAEMPSFTFQNAPVSTIIAAIEKAYGVDVVYDEEVMANCHITTSLDQESLYDKLTIICKLLGATYKIIDAQIVITGSGC